MSTHCVDSRPEGTRRTMRVGALALAALMLVTACATGAPTGGELTTYGHQTPSPRVSPGTQAMDSGIEDRSREEAVFTTLPMDFAPVQVSAPEFKKALTTLWLHMPPRVATSLVPLHADRRLAWASTPWRGELCQSDLAQSYGHFCERRGTPGDCLTLFEDGPRLQDDDKRSLALALAVGPALEGVDAEARAMLDPTHVLATLSFTIRSIVHSSPLTHSRMPWAPQARARHGTTSSNNEKSMLNASVRRPSTTRKM